MWFTVYAVHLCTLPSAAYDRLHAIYRMFITRTFVVVARHQLLVLGSGTRVGYQVLQEAPEYEMHVSYSEYYSTAPLLYYELNYSSRLRPASKFVGFAP